MQIIKNKIFTLFTLLFLLVFGGFTTEVWGWAGAKVYVYSNPSGGGYVYVNTSNSGPGSYSLTSDDASKSNNLAISSKNWDFYLFASAKSGYTFKGWATSDNTNSVESTTRTGYKVNKTGYVGVSYTEYRYYAIFARLAGSPASGNTLSFGNATVTETSGWQTITINHAHAGTVSISKSGHSDDFFIGESEDATSELESFESVSETTKTLHIQFRPTSNNLRTCTLTVSSNNGLSSLTYYLQGTGYAKPSITWVNEDGAEVTSGEVTLGRGEIIKATCATEQAITYSDYNSTYFEPVTYEGGPALRVKNNFTGTFSNLNVRANLAANNSSYIAAYSEDFKLNVTSLTPQRIVWEDDITDLDNSKIFPYYIPLTATAYDAETNNPSGMTITYGVNTTDFVDIYNGQLRVKAIGGPTIITATAAGSSSYAPISVSKQITVSDVKTACATKDTDDGGDVNKNNSYTVYVSTPGKMTFYVRRDYTLSKDLTVTEYDSGGKVLNTTTYGSGEVGTGGSGSKKEITLQPTTASVKFSSNANLTYHITSIQTERITSVSKDKNEITYAAYKSMESSAQLSITYSNVPVYLSFKHGASSKWSMDKSKIGGCGKRGSEAITLTFSAEQAGDYSDTLYIKSNTGKDYGFVKLTATVTALAQFLDTWNIADEYYTTDQTTLNARTTEDKTNFEFSVQSSSPANIVNIDANGVMNFNGSGTAVIKAFCPAYGIYEEFETTHNITISKVTPTIFTNPNVATIKYKDNLINGEGSQLSGGRAEVTLRGVEHTKVDGTFTWTTPAQITDAPGTHNYSVTFTPENTGMYSAKTFAMSVTISRADGGITMTDGEVKVKVAGINDDLDECKIDLDDLIDSKIIDAGRAGSVSFKVIGENEEYASINNNVFSATAVGTYTIVATQAQTDYYEAATDTFSVEVERLMPTIVFDNTDDPQIVYSGDEIDKPAYRMYNGHLIDRNVQYVSDNYAIYADNTKVKLFARNVDVPEGSAERVVVTASTTEDAIYSAASVTVAHNYDVYAKRSPVFIMDGHENENASKTMAIGETATITYNENTDETFSVGTETEKDFISYVHDKGNRTITVTAVKGSLIGDGVQTVTLTQPGNEALFQRQIVYTFTVKRNVSALSLDVLTTLMSVEDTVATPYAGLANTSDAVEFTCSPAGSMKMEDGKLIALQAGTNTVTFSQPTTEYWTGVSQSKTIKVSKHNATISTELANRYAWFSTIEHPFSSTNPDVDLVITSSDEQKAKYVAAEDKIYVYGTSGDVTFTVNQEGNYKYNPIVNYTRTFNVFKPNNHVPFTLTEGNFDDYRGGTKGNVSWDNGGVLCGRASGIGIGGAGWDWSAKYIILHFTGIPDTLTFDFVNANPTATQYGWHFYQSSNASDWIVLSEYADLVMNATGGTSEGSEALKLNPDTRYVKLEYHGNFGGRFRNIKVTERKEIAPRKDTLDFGLGFNGNDPTTRKLALDWYNVNTCRVYVDGADADRFILSDESDTIYSRLDDFGDAELTLTYKHDENSVTEHKAILHIVEVNPNGTDGISKEVVLLGQTVRAPQTIVWREDLTPMPSEGEFENAAYATSGGEVVLTSLNPEYVAVSGLTLSPVAPGIARVRAYQAGNEKWAEVADTLTIEVTTKKVQYIIWTDNLSNRKREDGETVNITLTATSTAGLPITYDLDSDAKGFASISGSVLTLTGWGRGTVFARQEGTDEYVGVQKSKLLVSRNPDEGCKPLVGEQTEEYTIWTLGVKDIPLYGEPGTIEFDAKCDATALYGLWVAEYYDGYYHDIAEIKRLEGNNLTSSYKHFGPYDLHRTTSKVRIYTHTGATMNRTFKNVEVVLAKYLEVAENNMDFSTMDYGASKDQTFYVNYSNITGQLDVELESPSSQFTILTPTLGEDCGDAAKDVPVRIRCVGSVIGTENNAIIISNKNQSLRVPISATVTPVSQAITWNPTLNIHTTDNVQLSATATSPLEVTFTSNNAEIAEPYRKDNGTWWLNIHKQGNVEIVAHQAGNEYWRAAEDQTREFHISRVTPNILVYPTATGVTLPNTLSASTLVGGSVENDIEGSFQWQNSSQAVTRGTESYGAMFAPENGNYFDTVRFNVSVEIIKTPQIITWDRADVTEQWCNDTIVCDASSSSNQPITYHSSDSSVAYVIADTLRIFKYGTITITAEQAGDEDFDAASVSKQITLKRAIVTLTLPEPSDMFVHHYLTNSVLNNGSATAKGKSVGGVFTWQKDSLMDVPGANDNCVALFTPFNTDIYAPQTCSLTVNVLRYAPGVSTNDLTTDPAPRGTKLSELVLRGSATLIDDKDPERPVISGTYSWKYPDYEPTENETSAIYVFHPVNSTWYNDLEISVPIFISKYTPRITQTLVASDITYGQALSASTFSGSFIAWDSIRDVKVNGSYAWVDGSQVLDAGDYNESVRFTPTNTAWYESVEFEVAVHVNKATPSVSVTASEITIGQKLKDSYLESTGTPGTPVWASCLNLDTIFGREGNYNLPYEFTPDDASNYTTKTGTVTLRVGTGDLYVFSAKGGNHKWDNEDNWENYMGVPVKDANVLINSSVEIESIVDIDKLTIKAGVEVVVKDGGSLTIKSGSVPGRNYGNLRVASGGKASLPANVGINDLTIEAALGNYVKHIPASSAQVDGASLSNVNGNVYFQLSFDPSGKISAGWYDFVVPFEVEVVGGIYSVSNSSSPLINRVDFGIMEFREDKRALNEKAWYWVNGTLEPGRLYSITLDDCHPERNTYLFKKKAGSSIGASSSYNAVCSGAATKSIASSDKGWNGLGNGTLRYCQVSLGKDTKIQVYDHDNACYVPLDAADYSYAIGTAFFVQVSSNQSIDLRAVNDNANKRFLALSRENETIEEFRLALTMEGEDAASDHLWVSASEEATGEYVIGKDLGKMGELTNSKVARMWAKNNGMSLCDIEMPMVYGEANCELNMYAPKQATYTLAVEEAPEDADLFLTYNGKVIWNLTSSPAQIVLNQGMKTDFGLILKSHNAPEIAEGVDYTDEENHSVRKVLIDNIIYVITPDGAMYDVNGKLVR